MKRNRRREMSIEVLVGAFLFMVLLALSVFTIILSREKFWQRYYPLDVRFDEILGVREGDNVFLRGVIVGRVKRITVEPDGVRLRMSLTRRPELREDYRVEILPSSVLGGRYVYLYEGSPDAPSLPEGAELRGITPVDVIDSATRVVQRIRDTLEKEGLLADLQGTIRNLNEVSAKLARGEGSLGRFMADDTVYTDIAAAIADLRKSTAALAEGQSTLGKLISDQGEIYADAAEVARNLREASERLNRAESLIGKLLAPDDTVYADLRATARSIRETADAVARGEGSLGKLLQQNDLYEEVRLLVNELRATIDDFRETAPISTFTSIFFGAF